MQEDLSNVSTFKFLKDKILRFEFFIFVAFACWVWWAYSLVSIELAKEQAAQSNVVAIQEKCQQQCRDAKVLVCTSIQSQFKRNVHILISGCASQTANNNIEITSYEYKGE